MEYFNNKYDEEESALAMSRTIEEVFDIKEGVFINASDFFQKPESELILWRRTLEESILIGKPRLVCPHCNQMVKLVGRRTCRGRIAFFSHLYDSDECDIKTNTNSLSLEEILAKKYGRVQESERHNQLKNFIANTLNSVASRNSGVSEVAVERRIESNVPYLNYRRPDVVATYKGRNLVFELQLSTTFLSVVVDRDIFYRLNNYFIIWVFNFDDNAEYVNLANLMCKDIYYANKRNVFILDMEAQQKSVEEGKLYLNCRWLDVDGNFTSGELVCLDQLSFDQEQGKSYYVDADEIYYQHHPESRQHVKQLEHSRQEIIAGLMDRMNQKFQEQLRWEKERQEAIAQIELTDGQVEPFEQNGLYGYKYKDSVIVLPYFNHAGCIDADGYGRVMKARKHGLVDRIGRSVVPCLYQNVEVLAPEHFVVKYKNSWKVFGNDSIIESFSKCHEWSIRYLNDRLFVYELNHNSSHGFRTCKHILVDSFRNIQVFQEIDNQFVDGFLRAKRSVRYFLNNAYDSLIDEFGMSYEMPKCGMRIAVNMQGMSGVVTHDFHPMIPFDYDSVDVLDKCKIRVCKDDYWGVIDRNNQVVIPIEYKCLLDYKPGYYIVQREQNFGVIDEQNFVTVPFEYKELLPVGDGNIRVLLDGKYGIIDDHNNIIIDIHYSNIQPLDNGYRLEDGKTVGFVNSLFELVVPCKYYSIRWQDSNYAVVETFSDRVGFCHHKEGFVIPPLFESLRVDSLGHVVCIKEKHLYHYSLQGQLISVSLGTNIYNERYVQSQNDSPELLPVRETVAQFGNDIIVFSQDGHYGILKDGDIMFYPVYKKIQVLAVGFIAVYQENTCRLFDQNLHEVLLPYKIHSVYSIDEQTYATITKGFYDSSIIRVYRNGSILNLPWALSSLEVFENGVIMIKKKGESDCFLCDSNFNILFGHNQKISSITYLNGGIYRIESSRHYGSMLMDSSFSLIPSETLDFDNGIKALKFWNYWDLYCEDTKVGTFDSVGQSKIDHDYLVLSIGNIGLYSKNFRKMLFECKYSQIGRINQNILFACVDRFATSTYRYIFLDGTPIDAETIVQLTDDYLKIRIQGKYGIADSKANIVVQPIYDQIRKDIDGKLIGEADGVWHNALDGSELLTDRKNWVHLKDNLFACTLDTQKGILDENGAIVYPISFDEIKLDYANHIMARIKKNWYDLSFFHKGDGTPIEGEICVGQITRLEHYGIFVEVPGLKTGLCHKSKMFGVQPYQLSHFERVVVKILQIHANGKIDYELITPKRYKSEVKKS